MSLRSLALLSLCVVLTACSKINQENYSKLKAGMSKAEVEKLFGIPAQVQGPVGQPPITRWHYPDYVVTFEYEHVVHTVLKHKPKVPVTAAEPTTEPAGESAKESTTESTAPATEPTPVPADSAAIESEYLQTSAS